MKKIKLRFEIFRLLVFREVCILTTILILPIKYWKENTELTQLIYNKRLELLNLKH